MMSSVIVNEIVLIVLFGQLRVCSGMVSRWWIVGFDMFRISSEQIVMLSCEVVSMSVVCFIVYSVVFVVCDFCFVWGLICDCCVEMMVNFLLMKKVFVISSMISQVSFF